jgi:hypothetical protein
MLSGLKEAGLIDTDPLTSADWAGAKIRLGAKFGQIQHALRFSLHDLSVAASHPLSSFTTPEDFVAKLALALARYSHSRELIPPISVPERPVRDSEDRAVASDVVLYEHTNYAKCVPNSRYFNNWSPTVFVASPLKHPQPRTNATLPQGFWVHPHPSTETVAS